MRTPYSEDGIRKLDDLPAADAVLLAWAMKGRNPKYHERAQQQVRDLMPVLGRALDRFLEQQRVGEQVDQ